MARKGGVRKTVRREAAGAARGPPVADAQDGGAPRTGERRPAAAVGQLGVTVAPVTRRRRGAASSSAPTSAGCWSPTSQPGGPSWGELADPDNGGPDIILEVEGKPVKTTADLREGVEEHEGRRHREPAGVQHAGEDPADRADQARGVGRRPHTSPPGDSSVSAGSIGNRRSRFPVSAKTAFATAGATGGSGGSPSPVGDSALGTKWTSTRGASLSRSRRYSSKFSCSHPSALHGDLAVERGAQAVDHPALHLRLRARSGSPPVPQSTAATMRSTRTLPPGSRETSTTCAT